MKNKLFVFLLVFTIACGSAEVENEAVINGKIEGVDAGELVNIAPEGDMNKMISVPVENGSFTIRIPVQPGEADWYQLWVGSVPAPSKLTSIYVEPGEMNITIPAAGFSAARFSGSAHAKEYDEVWRGIAIADSTMKARAKTEEGTNEVALFMAGWIKEHPASPLSTALLDKYKLGPLAMDSAVVYFKQRQTAATNNRPSGRLKEWIDLTSNVMPGKPAPEFSQPDTAGKPVALKDFRGKYVLLDFWASWCAPCRAENPNLVKAYEKYKDQGFTVLGVSLDDKNKMAWMKAIQKDGLPWTQVSDLKYFQNAAAELYHVQAIPANFLIDPNGMIIARNLRGKALGKRLEEVIENNK